MCAWHAGGSIAAVSPSLCFGVAGAEDVGVARRGAVGLGTSAGLSEALRSDIGIVTTELATNLFRHGGGGHVIMRALAPAEGDGVELIGVDRGPGIADLRASLRDGYSTAGSLGTGLGAMRRIAADFDVFTAPGRGTAIVARMRAAGGRPATAAAIAGICLPMPGERACGDGWTIVADGPRTSLCVVDGLGHGPAAAEAADVAREVFAASGAGAPPADALDALHRALRHTRGAAAAVAVADADAGAVQFGGIGNIGGTILSDTGTRSMVSHGGIVGHQVRRVQEFRYDWPPGATMVLHSDGLASHWRADDYPGVRQRDPALLCALLYRDSARGRDDTTVVACRAPGAT